MREYGGIEIPLKHVEKINLSSNMDAIDFMLDIDMSDKYNFIANMCNDERYCIYLKNIMFYYRVDRIYMSHRAVLMLITMPEPVLRDFKGQKYLILVSQNLEQLQRYLILWRASAINIKETQAVHVILQTLEYTMQIQSNHKLTY